MSKMHHKFGHISIHAPRGGSDCWLYNRLPKKWKFQSTLPVGGATFQVAKDAKVFKISIHAPRGGSDT